MLDTQKRFPLPAPTDPSSLDSTGYDTTHTTDVETNISTRTDKSFFEIPEDGSPVTINTAKAQRSLRKKFPSQTSLLIEYFDGTQSDGSVCERPSVRVRVTPSSRRQTVSDPDGLSQPAKGSRSPAFSRRISLGQRDGGYGYGYEYYHYRYSTSSNYRYSAGSNISSLPPVEIEVLHDASDGETDGNRYVSMSSNVSSMPPDSLLGQDAEILPPGRRRRRSSDREEAAESASADKPYSLDAPTHSRQRSMSKDRITQRVMEKLAQEAAAHKLKPAKPKADAHEELTSLSSPRRSQRRRSRDPRDEDMSVLSGAESSVLSSSADRRSAMAKSSVSNVSATSSNINNPKLLATVEDAIRRLILPELNALKEDSKTTKNKDKFERITRETAESTSSSRDPSKRRVSKSSSTPNIQNGKPKVVLNRDGDDPGTVLSQSSGREKEKRRSSKSSSISSYVESTTREKSHRKKGRDIERPTSARDSELASVASIGLTAAALKHHTSREEKEEERKQSRASRHRSSKSISTLSVPGSVDDEPFIKHVPALPFLQSEMHGSEMTRDSILSAETETRERPGSSSSKSTATGLGPETPLQEVPRGYPSPTPLTPSRTPNALQRNLGTSHSNMSKDNVRQTTPKGLGTPKSERSHSSRSKDATGASLEAAAAAKVRAIERSGPQASQYEIANDTPPRGMSPVQSEASYREDARGADSPRDLRSAQSGASVSSVGAERNVERRESDLSIASFASKPSTKVARTRKRPQGVNLESSRSALALAEPSTPTDAELFFEMNHEQNEAYRRENEEGSQVSDVNYKRMTGYTEDSVDGGYISTAEQLNIAKDVQRVGSNPEYGCTMAVESNVASLHDQSVLSQSFRGSTLTSPPKKSKLSQVSPSSPGILQLSDEDIPSGQRWSIIRDKAEAMNARAHPAASSPRQSIAHSIDETPQMHHSAFPSHKDMMPEIGYNVDDEDDLTTNPSIIQGPLGGGDGYHDQEDEFLNRQESRSRTPVNPYANGGAKGPGTGTGAAIIAAAAHHLRNDSQSDLSYDEREENQATVESDYESYIGEPNETQYEQPGYAQSNRTPSSAHTGWKDEGYQSANQREAYTPNRNQPPKLFDDDGFEEDLDETRDADTFAAGGKHDRHLSGNSHGMDSPIYDAATGKGIDHIQSKDIVALMDHLTVRDAQRNARDTEILVTLVRSASEMRNQLDEMKQFIKTQDNMIMSTTDKRVGLAEQRILGGPRPQPVASPRLPRSKSEDEIETKKKNVFKRALKGLSLKGDGDIKHIEQMLIQLLGDVEGLKQVQSLSLEQNRSNSLASYENLRASADPGYEPEGRANTASSPDQSGYLSNPSTSRRIQDLHSGFDVPQNTRISTVHEDSDEYDERDLQYQNTERMTTPTQEAMQNKRLSQGTSSPPQGSVSRSYSKDSSDTTPKRNSKQKSSSPNVLGIPKVSRWSKTTSSTNPESIHRRSGSGDKRPHSSHSRSTHSRSGSQQDDYYDDEPYAVRSSDRQRSNASLRDDRSSHRDDRSSHRSSRSSMRDDRSSLRSASPLIPDESELNYEMDDPKYQAHRNSLNLQHPQPRPGPTGRHQSHLEDAAQIYEPSSVVSSHTPDFDQWGSMPSLARNRMPANGPNYPANGPNYGGGYNNGNSYNNGNGNLSPISSDGGYSGHSASEQQYKPARASKVVDDGPLFPQTQAEGQRGTLAGYGQTRQMYSSPNEFGSQGVLTPLAPIAEVRYSLETDRGYRITPTPSPRPLSMSSLNSPQTRKITGPRPMGSRSPAPQGNGLGYSDTVVRRKPIIDDEESLLSYRSSLDSEIF